ncbi:4-(cytidine 5'-diphospho)-2-C-methyl-D-erythritol kinase [Roseibium hamelinense]|nr:4-(cytidine 5'-diphospho)-2-C-methyl-D-erythritol kinase [Roseibium hamelinense]
MNRPAPQLARAKINLALHVTGQRADGYHLLDSLVVFPEIGDVLTCRPGRRLELSLTGPFAQALASDQDNLILKAARTFSEAAGTPEPDLVFDLEKNLPVASGIGSGSADAAAALRLLQEAMGTSLAPNKLAGVALSLGADVPVCLASCSARMGGIGELLTPAPAMPEADILLVNPGVGISTPAVFKSMESRANPEMPDIPDRFQSLSVLVSYLQHTRNDMQGAAERLCPSVTQVIETLKQDNHIAIARMSGSGATCFGLAEAGKGATAAQRIRSVQPGWWVASAPLG